MDSFKADPKNPRIAGMLQACRVSTRRHTVSVISRESHTVSDFRWDGGTRTLTATYRCEPWAPGCEITLGTESVIAEHGTFCGKPATVTLYVHPELFASLKPAPATVPLPEPEKRVLALIATLNSRGRKEWRDEWGVSKPEWDAVVAHLTGLGYTRTNGAITPEGRNVADKQYQRDTYKIQGLNGPIKYGR